MSAAAPPIKHVTTVVPARNEADRIVACIRSLHDARIALPPGVTSSIVVVADACRDATAELAETHIDPSRDLVVRGESGSAGAARRLGTATAIERTPATPAHIWVCSTDADSTVPPGWFTTQLDAARRGYVAIAGVVRLDSQTDAPVRHEFLRTYLTGADGTHAHVHGTNLGFRADAYLAAGGWAPIPTAEDHDLWRRLGRLGRTISSVRLSVTTSGRTVGRAPDGFAATLATLVAAVGAG
ncbi:MAG TPA: glycosyltransferase [Ilumatobacter sp.]|nr:glycosyltransferase [Ilumatobacter sp.]